jgi:protein gp37
MALRLQAMGQPNYANGFELTMQRRMLELPLKWKQRQTIFVNSMSDLFHRGVTTEYVLEVFGVMNRANHHLYQVLTKRSQRLERLSPQLPWQPHIWMGVSVESREYSFRIDHLRNTNAHVKFLSLEPLLGPLRRLNLRGIDWVIVGGESGPYAREMKLEWVLDIRDQCLAARVPFFFKQWGGKRKSVKGRELQGELWNQMPATVAA